MADRPAPSRAQLAAIFLHRTPKPNQVERIETLRNLFLEVADQAVRRTPVCPEQTRAINALDESLRLFLAAILRNDGPMTEAEKVQRE